MIKPRLFFWTFGLFAVLMLSSCASAETVPAVVPTVEAIPATAAPADSVSTPAATADSPAQIADVQAVPTSRGPDLHASDPATVSLASGELQLVEFFRFT
ncbi:MAG: hypothetical protein QY332_12745 [Anaerolineales bacterium]|nr:MAG: hypothetical protein QY332_12745 [Anaerolineales bacterium]